MPEAASLLDRLDRLPLLGAAAEAAAEAALQAEAAVRGASDPTTEARLALHLGELARVGQRAGAVPLLARAARLADALGEPALARRAKTCVGRALISTGRRGVAARMRADLEPATPTTDDPDLGLLDLALGRLTSPEGLGALLQSLPSPDRDHDRVVVHRALAERWLHGGDRHAASAHLDTALALARQYGDAVLTLDLALAAASLRLAAGEAAAGEALLVEAADLAEVLDDTLALVVSGSSLAALRLDRGDWAGAAEAAEVELAAAERRSAWLAVADATLTLSTCLLHADEVEGAVHHLVTVGAELRARGSQGGVNLIKGRLGELRALLGPTVFDPLLWSA
jgi:hypothetical protein